MSKNFETEYKNNAMKNVPDLWDRIEAGIDELEAGKDADGSGNTDNTRNTVIDDNVEILDGATVKPQKKIIKFNRYFGIAAAVLLVGIAVVGASALKSSFTGTAMEESYAPMSGANASNQEAMGDFAAEESVDTEVPMVEETEESVNCEAMSEEMETAMAKEDSVNDETMLEEAENAMTKEDSVNDKTMTEEAEALDNDMVKEAVTGNVRNVKNSGSDLGNTTSEKIMGLPVGEVFDGIEYIIVEETKEGLVIEIQKDPNGVFAFGEVIEVFADINLKQRLLERYANDGEVVLTNSLKYTKDSIFEIVETD